MVFRLRRTDNYCLLHILVYVQYIVAVRHVLVVCAKQSSTTIWCFCAVCHAINEVTYGRVFHHYQTTVQ